MSAFVIIRGLVSRGMSHTSMLSGLRFQPYYHSSDPASKVTVADFAALAGREGILVGYASGGLGRVMVHVKAVSPKGLGAAVPCPFVLISFLDSALRGDALASIISVCVEPLRIETHTKRKQMHIFTNSYFKHAMLDGTRAFIEQFVFKSRTFQLPPVVASVQPKRAWETRHEANSSQERPATDGEIKYLGLVSRALCHAPAEHRGYQLF